MKTEKHEPSLSRKALIAISVGFANALTQVFGLSKTIKFLGERGNQLRMPHSKGLEKGIFELRERRFGIPKQKILKIYIVGGSGGIDTKFEIKPLL